MFDTTNLFPIRYLQNQDNAKAFLEALLGKSISEINRFYWKTNLPEAFDSLKDKPDIYLEDQSKTQYAIIEYREGCACWEEDPIYAAIVADYLSHYQSISEFPESYIIFVSAGDSLMKGLAVYDLSNDLKERDPNTRCHRLLLNTHYRIPNADSRVIKALDRIRSEEEEILRKEILVLMWDDAPYIKNRDEFLSEWALSAEWGFDDMTDGDEFNERARGCAHVWDVAHMGFKEIRESIGLTQLEVAKRLFIPVSMIRAWENGEDCPGYIRYMAALLLGVLKEVK